MSSTTLRFVRRDTRPPLYIQLSNAAGAPLNITGARVFYHFRQCGETTVKFSKQCTAIPGTMLADESIDVTAPYDVAGPGGLVQMDWPVDGLDEPGSFEGETEVIFADGTRLTVYDITKVKVRDDFGQAS